MTNLEMVLTVAIIGGVTFLTRAISFLIFPPHKPLPAFVSFLGQVLPISMMGFLVVLALKNTSFLTYPYGIPEVLASLVTVVIHLWRHNVILSIALGTIAYMLLVQTIFS